MTTTVSTRSAGTLNPTRQQLDELDALLQRMLELPVNKLEDTEQAAAEEPADEPPPPPVANVGERPVSITWSSSHQPANAGRSPLQLGTRPTMPPVSYMVVETASARPLPPASGFEPRPSSRTPRLVPVTPPAVETGETPIPLLQDKTDETPVPPTQKTGETPVPPTQNKTGETPVPPDETPAATGGEEMWVPLRSTWQPSAQTWQPLAQSWHQANSGLPMPETVPSPIPSSRLELSPPLVGDASRASPEIRLDSPDLPSSEIRLDSPELPPPTAVEPQLSLSADDAPIAVPRLLLPVLWFNQGFDACLTPLGAPGRWLCGSRGRQTLGLVGLTCLAAAVAIAVSAGMGWTW